MSDTILSAHIHILSTIAAKGDSVLSASEDPFVYDPGYGAFIRARSANGRHLTWTFLEGVVVALHNGLFLRGRYRASEFWIWDGVLGLVGLGEMGAGAVGGGVGMGTVVSVGKGNGEGNGNGTVSKVLDIAQEWRY
ncbi:hypothetical protein IMSHALPRED_001282 [Imshaugia aleurites]|uniref:Uncharacterized protein n=1 Tax=Imshaugia aleurites TaxID=172621 RepID=A0A8H3PFJ6_9LECA|nr:hypothetical protein IMSHALPRED_001282 [Imshaugia aleurites]